MSEDSFFSRWSRRKTQVREGLKPEQPAPAGSPEQDLPATDRRLPEPSAQQAVTGPTPDDPPTQVENLPPPPTLEDVARLTKESDFSPFVARHVPSEVRNAAVKKLFSDPHFNVMDGLDIYIDDYSKPSPLLATQMAKMVGAQFLKLVDDPNAARTDAPSSPQQQSQAVTTAAAEEQQKPPTDLPVQQARPEETHHDDHADLQLQPDDAPEPQGPGGRAG
jgi:hypothetical protein